MDIKYIGKEIILDAMASFPVGASISRQWDSIESNLRFKKIEQEINRIWEFIAQNPSSCLEHSIYELIGVIENNGLGTDLELRRTKSCMIILKELSNRSKEGQPHDPIIRSEECLEILKNQLNSSEDVVNEFKLVTYELERENLIYKLPAMSSPLGFVAISPKEYFFCKTDSIFQNWNPKDDAKKLIQTLLENDKYLSTQTLDNMLKWGPRRINSAVAFLHLKEMIYFDDELGGITYILRYVRLNEEAEFFLESVKT